MSLISSLFSADEPSLVIPKEITNYVEKINKFILQGFNNKQQLVHFVQADKYYSFKEKPALLLEPKVITYNKEGKEIYTLTSKRANYLDDGEIKFKGKVDIDSKSGVTYQVNTKELSVNTETNNLMSDKEIIYLDEKAKVVAQGMTMKSSEDKMHLIGKTTINQGNGRKILTRDLLIDQSKTKKHYRSKHKTTYLALGNKVYSQGLDMNIQEGLTTLLGKVKILQKTGTKIDTKKLIIRQVKGHEIYSTKEKVHYKSKVSDIRAKKGMHYDVKDQKIKLTGGVVGRYE
ncbi:MAG: Lipopolysaccharide export system protein LptC [Catillopecten margaritatus gill symbiont]|uniref:Lipopolysaccharide export system protein LptC n=1 Tax=Catillopecten margaritatus gill symbiont TaxID=3083288 RepID=A0AAU6PGJ3_9GAMM